MYIAKLSLGMFSFIINSLTKQVHMLHVRRQRENEKKLKRQNNTTEDANIVTLSAA